MGWRLEPRPDSASNGGMFVSAASLFVALVAGGLLMALLGVNPLQAYTEIFSGSLGSAYGLSETVVKAIPLTFTGLACLIAFRMLIWNIGAEGQLCMGAIATVAAVRYFPVENSAVMLLILFVSACIAGGLWGMIPGFLRAKWNVNEIIATLMLNYVAINFMDYLLYGPWKDPASMGFPMTTPFPDFARLPILIAGRIHLGIIIALVISGVLWLILRKSSWGYEIRAIGENAKGARYAGINIMRNILLVMFVSGAIAGLAGMGEVAGLQGRLSRGFSVGYGYTGIIVAWLARLNPLAVPFVAFLMAILLVGGDTIQVVMRLPLSSVLILQGLILFCVLAGDVLSRYRIRHTHPICSTKGVKPWKP